jgi:hypothetical protein
VLESTDFPVKCLIAGQLNNYGFIQKEALLLKLKCASVRKTELEVNWFQPFPL